MRSGDVDTNDWIETFTEWQTDVIEGLLSHYFVSPPASYAAAAEGAVTPGAKDRLHARVLGDDEPGDALSVEAALEKLAKGKAKDGKDGRYWVLQVQHVHFAEVLCNLLILSIGTA